MTHLVYPADYFNPKAVDEAFEEEALAMKNVGFTVVTEKERIIPDVVYLYRGWMKSSSEYQAWEDHVTLNGGQLLTSTKDYLRAHHLPNWYDTVHDLTPKTLITSLDNVDEEMKASGWERFFVKDFVKSLTQARGSIAQSPQEVHEILDQLEAWKGIEGGVCLREVHDFISSTEKRYFASFGQLFSPDHTVSPLAQSVAERLNLPFISIDLIQDKAGKEWLVEIGDGQVSDIKSPWTPSDFANQMKTFFSLPKPSNPSLRPR
jgi:hypothetical protein